MHSLTPVQLFVAVLTVVCGSESIQYEMSLHIKCKYLPSGKEYKAVISPGAKVDVLRKNCCMRAPNSYACDKLNIFYGDTQMDPEDSLRKYGVKHGDTVSIGDTIHQSIETIRIKCFYMPNGEEYKALIFSGAKAKDLRSNCCMRNPNPYECDKLNIFYGETQMDPEESIGKYGVKNGDTVNIGDTVHQYVQNLEIHCSHFPDFKTYRAVVTSFDKVKSLRGNCCLYFPDPYACDELPIYHGNTLMDPEESIQTYGVKNGDSVNIGSPAQRDVQILQIRCNHFPDFKTYRAYVTSLDIVKSLRGNCCLSVPNPYACDKLKIYYGNTLMDPEETIQKYGVKNGDAVYLRD